MLETFISEQTGRIVSFDKVAANAGQSPQLVALWCQTLGLPFQWANAGDWWDGSDSNFLDYWNKQELIESGNLPIPGDIVIFGNDLPGSGGYGHASIFVRAIDNHWEGFDSNWGGKSAHLQSHNWTYVLGWFTPKDPRVMEGSTPVPIADEAPSDSYDLVSITPKIIHLPFGATLYNLQDVAWDSFQQNTLAETLQDTDVRVVALAKHRLGGSYYMPDMNQPGGYNIESCQDITGDPPKIHAVSPQLPALSPEPIISHSPFAPLVPSSSTNTVQVMFDIPKYRSMGDALKRSRRNGELRAGRYFIFRQLNGVINVTPNLGEPVGIWINPEDLKPKPDWRTTYKPFRNKFGEITSKYFVAIEHQWVVDLERGHELEILAGQPILIGGYFTGPDGETYARPYDAAVRFSWFGARADNLIPEIEVTPESAPELDVVPAVAPPLGMRAKIVSVLQNPRRVFDIIKTKI